MMKPMGQKPHKRNFTDIHPQKDDPLNWWEVEGCDENKAADRKNAMREIDEQLEENTNAF